MTQPRFDEARDIYRDCPWCGGAGCIFCKQEADKAYKRQFPDGPQPIAVFQRDNPADMARLSAVLSAAGIADATQEARRRASEKAAVVAQLVSAPVAEVEAALADGMVAEVIAERLAAQGA